MRVPSRVPHCGRTCLNHCTRVRRARTVTSSDSTETKDTSARALVKLIQNFFSKERDAAKSTFSVRNLKQDNRRRPRAEGDCNVACSNAWATPPGANAIGKAFPTASLRCRGQALENCYVETIRPKEAFQKQSQLLHRELQ